MLSKRFESTVVNRRTWIHVPAVIHLSTSSDTRQVVENQIETSTKMYTTFLIGLNNDMDYMRFSVTGPLSVIIVEKKNWEELKGGVSPLGSQTTWHVWLFGIKYLN